MVIGMPVSNHQSVLRVYGSPSNHAKLRKSLTITRMSKAPLPQISELVKKQIIKETTVVYLTGIRDGIGLIIVKLISLSHREGVCNTIPRVRTNACLIILILYVMKIYTEMTGIVASMLQREEVNNLEVDCQGVIAIIKVKPLLFANSSKIGVKQLSLTTQKTWSLRMLTEELNGIQIQ